MASTRVPRRCPRRARFEVAARQRVAVEVMLGGELHRDAKEAARRQTVVLVQNERRLQIVVEGNDPRAVRPEVVRRRLLLEVDEDALDGVHRLDAASDFERLGEHVVVDTPALEHLPEHVLRHAARDDVRVERVDVRVGFGVVAEESLPASGCHLRTVADRGARLHQRRKLVAQLIAYGSEAQAEEVLEVRLEGEGVPRDAVEAQLVLEATAHLFR